MQVGHPEPELKEVFHRKVQYSGCLSADEGEPEIIVRRPSDRVVDTLDELPVPAVTRQPQLGKLELVLSALGAQFGELKLVLSSLGVTEDFGLPGDLVSLAHHSDED